MSRHIRSATLAALSAALVSCGGKEAPAPLPPTPTVAAAPTATPVPTPIPTLPPGKMSRGDFAVELVKAKYGETFEFPKDPFFFDVPPADPRFKYIQKFRADELTRGCSATMFCPHTGLPRFALATFLVRAKYGDTFTPPANVKFADVPASHENLKYMQKAVADGLMKPCSAGSFCPDELPSEDEIKKAIGATFRKK